MSNADATGDGDRTTDQTVRELAFFGKITASVTHELNNVIAIVDQSAGLLDDLAAGEEQGVPLSIESLTGATASIQKQTQRGLRIIERLNRFAHSTDHPRTKFDLHETLRNLTDLAQRLAGQKRVTLEYRASSDASMAGGNPFLLQLIVFDVLQLVNADTTANSTTLLSGCLDESGALVTIDFYGTASESMMARLEDMRHALLSNQKPIAVDSAAEVTRLTLRFPLEAVQS